jgi:hypothetical protein
MHDHKLEANPIETTGAGRHQHDVKWFHYIDIHQAPKWEACGWMILEIINEYAVLGEWKCDCPMVIPATVHSKATDK